MELEQLEELVALSFDGPQFRHYLVAPAGPGEIPLAAQLVYLAHHFGNAIAGEHLVEDGTDHPSVKLLRRNPPVVTPLPLEG
ncbi:MAG: hypothetical protein Q8J99_02955 [Sulfuritalea sp.]|nr:hypothetical protein [Sulfuritalea sp.]